jgi:hypothetical protein
MWQKLILKASCISNLFHQDRWWIENSIAKFWGEWGQNIRRKPPANSATPGPRIIQRYGSRVTSYAVVFGFCGIQQLSPNLPTHRTSPSAIFSYFRRCNLKWRDDVLTALKRSRPYRRTWWERWPEMTFRSASNHGNCTRIVASMPKGTTSKGIGRIEISVSGKATADEFRELLGSNSYIHLRMYINTSSSTPPFHNIGRQ